MSSSVFERVQNVVSEQLGVDPEKVTPDAEFVQDLNADSLDLVELIMQLEEEFSVEISDEQAESIVTVGDALEFIQEHADAEVVSLVRPYVAFFGGQIRQEWMSERPGH